MSTFKQVMPGIFAGVATSTILTLWLMPAPKPVILPQKEVRVIEKERIGQAQLQQLLRTAEHGQQVDTAQPQAAAAPPEPEPAPAAPQPGPTSEMILADLNRNHSSQAVDPVWAPKAEKSLSDDFEKYAEDLGYQFSGVECRDDSCKATFEFADFEAARDQMMHLTGRGYSVRCSTGATVPTPEDPKQPYAMQLFLTACHKNES
jgi:hypothetical protein